MKTNRILQFFTMAICAVMFAFVTGCEGPEGPAGADGADGADGTNGTNGTNGVNAAETCKECHNPEYVELISTQFQLSKHEYGEAAFEEAGIVGCTPCHAQEAFKDVVARNVPATFTIPTGQTRYANNYATTADKAYGDIGCSTCHSDIHNNYDATDLPSLTTVAPVAMSMWAGAKTIDLQADGGISNLCVKCHQPRPLTQSNQAPNTGNGNVLNYDSLAKDPTKIFYSKADPGKDVMIPGYRSHVHYGSVGAIMAGKGGVEFAGSVAYANSPHTAGASCQDCHMGVMNGRGGGHTFSARVAEPSSTNTASRINYLGCNTTGCHTGLSATSSVVTSSQAAIKAKLDALAAKLVVGGVEILNRDSDAEHNLWYNGTTNHYDGYLNVYDPINNPNGLANNPTGTFKNNGSIPSSWTQAQKDQNNLLPEITLTNAQIGAIINFQMCLREFSLGMHNYKYSDALLANSIAIVP